MKKLLVMLVIIFVGIILNSCYQDKYNELHPDIALIDGCDTTRTLNYTSSISVIMGVNCTSCHSGKSAAGGIKLDSYSNVVSQALSGKLMGTIKHQNSYKAMPPATTQIRDCEITRLDEWIANGMPQ